MKTEKDIRAEERAATERDCIKRLEDAAEANRREAEARGSHLHRTYADAYANAASLLRLPDPKAPRPAPTETAAAEPACPPCRDGAPHQFMRDGGDCLACGWGPAAAEREVVAALQERASRWYAASEPSSEPAPCEHLSSHATSPNSARYRRCDHCLAEFTEPPPTPASPEPLDAWAHQHGRALAGSLDVEHEKRLREHDSPRVEGEPIDAASPEPAKVRGRTTTYGNGLTWPWWCYVEPTNDYYNLPDEKHRFQLGLSDDALDAAYGKGWENERCDGDDGLTIAEAHAAAWRLDAAILSPEPAKVRDESVPPGYAELIALEDADKAQRGADDFVAPRESSPPPGFELVSDEHDEECGGPGAKRWTIECDTLAEAWRIYDHEHGYAPTRGLNCGHVCVVCPADAQPPATDVIWTDGRATVGGVTLQHWDVSAAGSGSPCHRVDISTAKRGSARILDADEGTAKRLAVAVAIAMEGSSDV